MTFPRSQASAQSGFTLVETMIALVVTSMLTALLVSALFFAARTQTAVSDSTTIFQEEAVQRSRFDYVIGTCLPGRVKAAPTFIATEDAVRCYAGQSLSERTLPVPLWINWKLERSSTGDTDLVYFDEAMPVGAKFRVAQFPGKVIFQFRLTNGEASKKWPPSDDKTTWLPERIEIVAPGPEDGTIGWVSSIRASSWPEPESPSLFGIPLR